jgi:hypothetical protein
MSDYSKRLLSMGRTPPASEITVPVPEETFVDLCRFCNLLYAFSEEVRRLYYKGHPVVKRFVEYGIPDLYLDLLARSEIVQTHKILFRFDFFLTKSGAKLIEVSSNPWGLLAYEGHVKTAAVNVEPFSATEIYEELCARLGANKVAIWRHFGFDDDTDVLIRRLGEAGIKAEKVDIGAALNDYDAIFYDIETAHFDGTLSLLLPHAPRLLPSPANELLKRKNFMALLYAFTRDEVALPCCISRREKEFMREFLVATTLFPDHAPPGLRSGVIKDVVGIWGLQVTILPPELAAHRGTTARRLRTRFRQHLRQAMINRNAILEDYIAPVPIPGFPELFTEFSVVGAARNMLPYARIYHGTPYKKRSLGDGLVRLTQCEFERKLYLA